MTLNQTPIVDLNPSMDAYIGVSIVRDLYQQFAKDFGKYSGMTLRIPFCDTISVYAQNLASVSNVTISGGTTIKVNSSIQMDQYSKFQMSGQAPVVKFHFRNDISGLTQIIEGNSGNIVFSPTYNGPYLITIEIFDGTFTSTKELGSVFYRGGQPCCGGDVPL